ncbi:MAG TPA: septum formation family protein [Candidatus Limnocylindrales bacterium]|nr:septum formation family protein [Candidatus Limnocylindrales bacterium]
MEPAYPPPAPPKKGINWIAIIAAIVIIGAIAGGFWLFRDRLSGSATDLTVGDCFDEPDLTTNITDVQHQPCADPHDGEVFAVLEYTPDGGSTTYPLIDTFRDYVSDQCVPALESYTGRTGDDIFAAGFSFAYLYPSSESWSDGDREITCYITKEDAAKFSGTLRGAGSSPSAT